MNMAFQQPRRQRRLDQTFDSAPSYFLTLCTNQRKRLLDNQNVFQRVQSFADESLERYGIFVDCYLLMPEHAHLIITISPASSVSLGQWIKAFKSMVAAREFRWQAGFFDHVLRSDESRADKWEYIRMNPVRAGLAEDPADWPYAQYFNRFDGSEL